MFLKSGGGPGRALPARFGGGARSSSEEMDQLEMSLLRINANAERP